jgi:hypothetical protein
VPTDTDNHQHDEEIRARHERAVAAGEKRFLTRTMDHGRLHSYAADEIGFARAGSGPIVATASGMVLLAAVFAAVTVFSIFLVAAPTSRGESPLWGALVLTVIGASGVLYAVRLAVSEFKARRIRRERGLPEPSPRQLN